MARLNEPPVAAMSADTVETLRRKFLRQNRDMAKVNSIQSLRIRQLELDSGRLLSENLGLRSQILDLERQLKESRAQRVADHALEIKERMEAQLVEWGAMLASLGNEPPPQRPTPRARKMAKTRASMGRMTPSQAKWREMEMEREAAVMQDGRLPPILENKPFPRPTLNRDELLGLGSRLAASEFGSPEMPPPPTSRFVDETPKAIHSSAHADGPVSPTQPGSPVDSSPVREAIDSPSQHKPAQPTAPPAADGPRQEEEAVVPAPEPTKPPPPPLPPAEPPMRTVRVLKAGAKRKLAVRDDEDPPPPRPARSAGSEPARSSSRGHEAAPPHAPSPAPGRERHPPAGRTLKELASLRKEARAKLAPSSVSSSSSSSPTPPPPLLEPAATRRPLAAKSTNEDVTSPQKAATRKSKLDPANTTPVKVLVLKERPPRERQMPAPPPEQRASEASTRARSARPPPPPPPPPAPIAEPSSPTPLRREASVAGESLRQHGNEAAGEGGSTSPLREPPPAFNVGGDAARPSRRARVAVSYAEPNLRDKMRRPTKELFDAVAGEGRFMQRNRLSDAAALVGGAVGNTSAPPAQVGGEDPAPAARRRQSAAEDGAGSKPQHPQQITTLLADLSVGSDSPSSPPPPTKAEMPRRKSSLHFAAQQADEDRPSGHAKPSARDAAARGRDARQQQQQQQRPQSPEPAAAAYPAVDPYDFSAASTPDSADAAPPPARQSKASRRLSSITMADLVADLDGPLVKKQQHQHARSSASVGRKRASMHSNTTTTSSSRRSMMDADDSYEGSVTGELPSRVSVRRRSTLL